MTVKWYIYTFTDGYKAITQKLNSSQLSKLTHEHGRVVRKERYKG